MEKIEKLFRLALHYKTSFCYYRSPEGNISVSLTKNGLVLDYTIYIDGFEWICAAKKDYRNLDDAIKDYENFILLK